MKRLHQYRYADARRRREDLAGTVMTRSVHRHCAPVRRNGVQPERRQTLRRRPNEREDSMTRNAFIALGAGMSVLMTVPLAAQSAGQGGAASPAPAAQATSSPAPASQATTPPAASPSAVTPAAGDDPAPQPADTKADPKAKAKADAACGTPVRAGPDQGQVIGKCKAKTKADDEAPPKN
jgi:hypothetical protein